MKTKDKFTTNPKNIMRDRVFHLVTGIVLLVLVIVNQYFVALAEIREQIKFVKAGISTVFEGVINVIDGAIPPVAILFAIYNIKKGKKLFNRYSNKNSRSKIIIRCSKKRN